MALDVSKLADYVKDNKDILITGALTGSKTGEIVVNEGNLLTGIKTSERIADLDTEVVFQNGDGCGFNPLGDTKITQRVLEVGNVKVEDSICVPVLEKKFTQLMMKAGTNNDALPQPLEEVYTDRKISKIESAIEKADWQGDKASGVANLNKYDGYLKLIDNSQGAVTLNARKGTGTMTADTGSATVNGTGTAFSSQVAVGDKLYSNSTLVGTVSVIGSDTSLTLSGNAGVAVTNGAFRIVPAAIASPIVGAGLNASNILAAVDSVVMGIPEAVMEGEVTPRIWMGWDLARLYLMALKNANLFHFTTEDTFLKNGFNVPGFPIRVEPTPGLSGTGRIVGMSPANMWLGVDLEHEEEDIDVWYEKKDDAVLSRTRFKRGVQIGFPDEVVQFLAA
jgi:hypothetical protein